MAVLSIELAETCLQELLAMSESQKVFRKDSEHSMERYIGWSCLLLSDREYQSTTYPLAALFRITICVVIIIRKYALHNPSEIMTRSSCCGPKKIDGTKTSRF